VEINGYQATLPEALGRMTTGTVAIVVYRSVNADMTFMYAVDGTIVRWFDPLLYRNIQRGDEPRPEETGLPFGTIGHSFSAAFACAERLSGVRLTVARLEDRDDWIAVGLNPGHPRGRLRPAWTWSKGPAGETAAGASSFRK
jgi:hypothetical protein